MSADHTDIPRLRCAELVMVGTELLLGQITDTNAVFLAQRLSELGLDLYYKNTVGDNLERMVETVRRAVTRSDLVVVVGGLGPTEDDLTRQAIARVAETDLEFRPDMLANIEERFAGFGVVMTENNRRQAYAPRGSINIPNPVGTAPSFAIECKTSETHTGIIIALPGVPREMKYLWQNAVVPMLTDRNLLSAKLIKWRTLKICGAGESRVDTIVGELVKSSGNPTVGLLAAPGEVNIRITAKSESEPEADAMLDAMETELRRRLGDLVFGTDDDTLASVIGRLVRERGWRMAVVDAMTLGTVVTMLAEDATDILAGAYVLPNRVTINKFAGTDQWSEETLAETARSRTDADIVLVLGVFNGASSAHVSGPGINRTHTFGYSADSVPARRRLSLYSLDIVRRSVALQEHSDWDS
ncbi:MAG: CinA family nicotinamide mononucleotide deamidase-related protein [Candidatus Hydrogenedentes bacterium]|nr:CinA family nicotinamide mononucleotide deamidase-related protein [Candidatus Hydrogenedentota bacterium]